jgi:predicted ATPase
LNLETGENFAEYKRFWEMKKKSFTSYVTEKLGPIERGFSNGESGMMYLAEMIQQEGLYLLDEPENSMSCQFQKNLAEIITFSAKNCNSQFIIATHSPFLLAIPNAKIYNLDKNPVTISKFWELDNMKEYYKLFTTYSEQFKAG